MSDQLLLIDMRVMAVAARMSVQRGLVAGRERGVVQRKRPGGLLRRDGEIEMDLVVDRFLG